MPCSHFDWIIKECSSNLVYALQNISWNFRYVVTYSCWIVPERSWLCGLYIVSQLLSPSSLSAAPEDFVRARWRWSVLWISQRTIYSPSNTPLLPPLRVWTKLWQYWCHPSRPALYGQVWFYTYRKKNPMVLDKTTKVQACIDGAEIQVLSTHPTEIFHWGN